jgi:hypothetical protein
MNQPIKVEATEHILLPPSVLKSAGIQPGDAYTTETRTGIIVIKKAGEIEPEKKI